jgi:hypothetical protein
MHAEAAGVLARCLSGDCLNKYLQHAPHHMVASCPWGQATWLGKHVLLAAYKCMSLFAGVDAAFTAKPLWDSYLRYIDDGSADGAMFGDALGRGKFVKAGLGAGGGIVSHSPCGNTLLHLIA